MRSHGQAVWLRLEGVSGLVSVHLNGRELTLSGDREPHELLLDGISGRNELELQVDRSDPPPESWGDLALVIRQPDDLEGPSLGQGL